MTTIDKISDFYLEYPDLEALGAREFLRYNIINYIPRYLRLNYIRNSAQKYGPNNTVIRDDEEDYIKRIEDVLVDYANKRFNIRRRDARMLFNRLLCTPLEEDF